MIIFVMHIEMLVIKTSLVKEVGGVHSWDIHMERKGWRVYDVEKREYFISREVVFPYVKGMEQHLGHKDDSPNTPDTVFNEALEEHKRKVTLRLRESDKHDACKEMSENLRSNGVEKKHNMVILIFPMTREVVRLRIRMTQK